MNSLFITTSDDFNDKTHCYYYGDLISPCAIEEILGIDVGIAPNLFNNFRMRDYKESNGIWAKSVKIMQTKCFARDLQIPSPSLRQAIMSSNMSRLLQKLEHCTGENAKVLHEHLKQSKLKIKGLGIGPNSRESITDVVSSFTWQLGN
jgi:hypothetical protein